MQTCPQPPTPWPLPDGHVTHAVVPRETELEHAHEGIDALMDQRPAQFEGR